MFLLNVLKNTWFGVNLLTGRFTQMGRARGESTGGAMGIFCTRSTVRRYQISGIIHCKLIKILQCLWNTRATKRKDLE